MGGCSWDFEILELLRLRQALRRRYSFSARDRRPQGKLGNFLRGFM